MWCFVDSFKNQGVVALHVQVQRHVGNFFEVPEIIPRSHWKAKALHESQTPQAWEELQVVKRYPAGGAELVVGDEDLEVVDGALNDREVVLRLEHQHSNVRIPSIINTQCFPGDLRLGFRRFRLE